MKKKPEQTSLHNTDVPESKSLSFSQPHSLCHHYSITAAQIYPQAKYKQPSVVLFFINTAI